MIPNTTSANQQFWMIENLSQSITSLHDQLRSHLSNTVIFLSIGSLTRTAFPFPEIVKPST